MKDITTRTIYGALFVAILIGSILLHPFAFLSVIGVAVLIGMYEFVRLFYREDSAGKHLVFYIAGFVTYLIIAFAGLKVIPFGAIVYLVLIPFVLMAFELFRREGASWQHLTVYFGGLVYLAVPFGMMNALFYINKAETAYPGVLIALFVLVWANDVFAYLSGTFFGKHKLFPSVSPKKSWEGSIGGLVFTALFAVLIYSVSKELNLRDWLLLALLVSVLSTIGDLSESLLKRNCGVKDSGRLIPGHGGILDRFDAVLFVTPFVYFYFTVV